MFTSERTWIFVMALVVGCSGGGDGEELLVCSSGTQRNCMCPTGAAGIETCLLDGSGFGECVCAVECEPDCSAIECGPDPVCAESCGTCSGGATCSADGMCVTACEPQCGNQVCGADPVCNLSCGTCGADESCSDDFTCVEVALTLAGRTYPASLVELVGSGVFSVSADATGAYELPLPALPDETLIVLRSVNSGAKVELYSVLETFDQMVTAASGDRVLEAAEHAGVDIDPRSTVRTAALVDANAGTMPTTRIEIEDAERYLDRRLLSVTLLEGAGLLAATIATGEPVLPSAFATTWALARNLDALRDFVRANQPESVRLDGAATQGVQALLDAAEPYRMFDPVGDWEVLRRLRGDYPGRGAWRYTFASDGRGARRRYPNLVPEAPESFSWADDGQRITMLFDEPQSFDSALTADEVVALVGTQDEAQIRAILGDGTVAVPRTHVSTTLLRLGEGIDVEWVAAVDEWEFDLRGVAPPLVLDVVRGKEPRADLWHRSDRLARLPLEADEMQGRWVLPVKVAADRSEIFDAFQIGDTIVAGGLVEFAVDGTAMILEGATTSSIALTWTIDAQERVVLTYPDGTVHTIAQLEETTIERAFLHTIQYGEVTAMNYSRARRVDETATLDRASLMHTATNDYWQTMINWSRYESPTGRRFANDEVFGFAYRAGPAVDQILWDDDLRDYEVVSDVYGVQYVDGDVYVDLGYSTDGRIENCTGVANCLPIRRRIWQPVAREGDHLFVMEQYLFHTEWIAIQGGGYTWDETRGEWVDTAGDALALDDYIYAFPMRLNLYRRATASN